MGKRTSPSDSHSFGLFAGEGTQAESAPGHSDIQRELKDASSRAVVFTQPMQMAVIRPLNGKLTKPLTLLYLRIIQLIQQQPYNESAVYELRGKDLIGFLDSHEHYDRLKRALRTIAGVQVEWNSTQSETESRWAVGQLVGQAVVTKRSAELTVEINLPQALNRGVREMRQFSNLNLLLAQEMRTTAAVNLFRIAVAYETNPTGVTHKAPPLDWAWALAGEKKEQIVYKYWKRDVLLPAIAEVNQLTHLTLELVEYSQGRLVAEIQLRVRSKEQDQVPSLMNMVSAGDSALIEELRDFGLSLRDARAMLGSFGNERVRRNLDYAKKRASRGDTQVRSKLAYLRAAVKDDYAESSAEPATPVTVQIPTNSGGRAKEKDEAAREVVLQEFAAARRKQASDLFQEMTRRESERYWNAFDRKVSDEKNQTMHSLIKKKGLKAKVVEIAFLDFLADELLGKSSEQALLEYLVERAAQTPRAKGRSARATSAS